MTPSGDWIENQKYTFDITPICRGIAAGIYTGWQIDYVTQVASEYRNFYGTAGTFTATQRAQIKLYDLGLTGSGFCVMIDDAGTTCTECKEGYYLNAEGQCAPYHNSRTAFLEEYRYYKDAVKPDTVMTVVARSMLCSTVNINFY